MDARYDAIWDSVTPPTTEAVLPGRSRKTLIVHDRVEGAPGVCYLRFSGKRSTTLT